MKNFFKSLWNKLFPSKCPIKIGDYFLQTDGGDGRPILRIRKAETNYSELYKGYYPIAKPDDWFTIMVDNGSYKVINQETALKIYGKLNTSLK